MPVKRNWNEIPQVKGKPDFANLLKVLRRERPARPTLFEFFLNKPLYDRLIGKALDGIGEADRQRLFNLYAFRAAGYDYATFHMPGYAFEAAEAPHLSTRSLNDGAVISDRRSFRAYKWPDPEGVDYAILDRVRKDLPAGMKVVTCGPGGVLENAIRLVGYDRLCYMIADDPGLARDVFDAIGERELAFYAHCVKYEAVGAIIGNDDWGFKSQTMLSPDDMRRYVFPWHEKIVATAHAAGKPAILHSCGNLSEVMEDVIRDMKYDGKHSYEDTIQPVEDAYEQYGGRIAIMGGIDVDFVIRSPPEAVYERSKAMLERAANRGGFALGTGNSVPEYVPDAQYFAMTRAALDPR